MLSRRKFTMSAGATALAATLPSAGRAANSDGIELLKTHDGIGLAALVRAGEVKPRELVEASIKAYEALDGKINALPMKDFERALDRADHVRPQGPFAGVPFSIKDTANVAGLPSPTGNKFFVNRVPTQSAGLVRLYEAAGFIIMGKTNTPEMSLIPTTEGGVFGACRNPWNIEHSSGGSSGGAAASVAAGCTPVAHGTDGAGSIRGPSSHCGLFGLMPGRDRVLSANSQARFAFDHVLSRSVRDSALSLAITQNQSPDIALPRIGFVRGPSKRRLKIGLQMESYAIAASPGVKTAIEATARLCESLGHEIIETKQPLEREAYERNYIALFGRNMHAARKAIEAATGKPVLESGLMGRFLTEFGNQVEGLEAKDFEAANDYLESQAQRFNIWMTPFDVVLSPVLYAPAPRLGVLFDQNVAWEEMSRRIFDFVSFTSPQNAFGLPGMSVPLAWSSDGLPIGSHFFAKYGQEPMLLELAYELEAVRPWKDKWAPNSIANL